MNPFRTHFVGISNTNGLAACIMDETGMIVSMFRPLGEKRAAMLEIWRVLGKMNRVVVLTEIGLRFYGLKMKIVNAGIILLEASREAVNAEFVTNEDLAKEVLTRKLFNMFKQLFPEHYPAKIGFMRCVLMAEFTRRLYTGEEYELRRKHENEEMPATKHHFTQPSDRVCPKSPYSAQAPSRKGQTTC